MASMTATHLLLNTQFKEAAFPEGPTVWSVGVGCQPLCICKSLGNGSWMVAGSLFVGILQSFSLGRTSPLPLLVSLMPLCLLALPVFLFGTFSAAHAAVSVLWRRNTPNTNISPLRVFLFYFLLLSLWPASPVFLLQFVIYVLQNAFWQPQEKEFKLNPGNPVYL